MTSVVRPHVPEDELHAYSDGELSPPQRVEIAEHLLGCLICRAQHAEVEELRVRTSALLAIAAPMEIRRPVVAEGTAPRVAPRFRSSGRTLRRIAAAAVAVIGAGLWFTLRPAHQPASTVEAAQPVIPGFATAATGDPVTGQGWRQIGWTEALAAGHGSIATLPGLAVTRVLMRASADSARPVFVVRQQLGDQHAVWIVDVPTSQYAALEPMLLASGLSVAAPHETRPRVVGTPSAIAQSHRMVTVLGNLTTDSLAALLQSVSP